MKNGGFYKKSVLNSLRLLPRIHKELLLADSRQKLATILKLLALAA